MGSSQQASIILLSRGGVSSLPLLLRSAFTDSWVASYQIGFGPPIVRCSDRVREEAKNTRSVLEKLDVYLRCCYLDPAESRRLAQAQRRLLVRRLGPLEAEGIDLASAQVLDLSIRLHAPAVAPPSVRVNMQKYEVDEDWVPVGSPPELLSGRFLIHLHDPQNRRLLQVEKVQELLKEDAESALAVELRFPVQMYSLWRCWLQKWREGGDFLGVDLGEPKSHAIAHRNGQQL